MIKDLLICDYAGRNMTNDQILNDINARRVRAQVNFYRLCLIASVLMVGIICSVPWR